MDVGASELLVAATAVLIGSVVQGSIGVGLNIVAAPFVALVVPEALPATLVLVAVPLAITTLVREHHALDRLALPWMLAGALPGTAIGLLIVEVSDISTLTVIVAVTTLSGVALSVLSPPVPTTRMTSLAAGFTSNVFGTATAVGGPPVALLFQHRTGPTARATLGAFFATSAALSLVGYTAAGEIDGDQVLFALVLAPVMVTGVWLSRHFHIHVDRGWLRPAVLTLSAVAGAAALGRGLT
ncbi:MAG TPA: sulfite exporter TauE/SafE family protein [Acidimicrobiia bacterium]